MSHYVDGADELLLLVEQRSEVAVGKCVGRQDLRRKRGTSGFSAGAEICLSSTSSANISQVPCFSFHVGPLEPVVSDLGHFFEAFSGRLGVP